MGVNELYKCYYEASGADRYASFNITKLKENKMSVVEKIKQLSLSKGDRLLRKYELVDERGDLTDEGREVLDSILLAEYKDQLVAKVEELDKAEKSKKK